MKKATQTAANLTSTLLKHHVAPRLESILDKESKISHDMFSAQIESRIGSGDVKDGKGPDMKVWGKGKGIENVSGLVVKWCPYLYTCVRLTGLPLSSAIRLSSFQSLRSLVMTSDTL